MWGLTRRVSPNGWGILLVVAGVLLANAPYLLGIFDPNPLGLRSGLGVVTSPGPLGGGNTIDPNTGFSSQALGHRAMLDLLHGHMPWWNPYEGLGAPLAAGVQSSAFFPLTLLTLFSNGQIYEHVALELIAGISTYLLLMRLNVARWAAVGGGIAFALNGTFAWFAHATVNPVAFLPMLLLGIEAAYSAAVEGRRGGWWLIAIAGALSFYAGFPEVTYINTLLAVAWFAWRCGCLGRKRFRPLVMKGASGAVVGTLLTAPLLVAFAGFLAQGEVGAHAGPSFGQGHFPAIALPQALMPYVYGPIFRFADPKLVLTQLWEKVGGYLSTSLLLFGLLGALSKGRRGLKVVLLAWIVLAGARMFGVPVLRDVLGVLPGMPKIAFYRYATSSVELAVIILAAIGVSSVAIVTSVARRRLLAVAAVSLTFVAWAAIAARSLTAQLGPLFGERPYYAGSVAWGVSILLAAVAASFLREPRRRVALLALLLVADAMALFVAPEFSAPRGVSFDRAPVTYLQRHLGQQRFFTLGPIQPQYGSYFGLASVNVNDLPLPKVFTRYVHTRLDRYVDPGLFVGNNGGGRNLFVPTPRAELEANLAGYRQAGVSYVLTPATQKLPESAKTFTLVQRSPTTSIYRLAGASPYFTASRGCAVSSTERQSAEARCERSSTLVRREADLPGWTAQVDGRKVPIVRAQDTFQSILLPAGAHRIKFGYSPPYVLWGYLAFAGGCLWLLAAGARRRRS